MANETEQENTATLFGHPAGLFTLFFAEMWERFSYYGMRALLLFYMIKGFLGLNDSDAYGIYGAYTALVYMTPYFGGMLADKLLGRKRAVVLGGLLMAAGHLLMTVEQSTAFFVALALLIAGNGFFKPNISTIVGELYPKTSEKKDGGFTIFYMGINLGAAMSPIVCGYVGETFGWHYGFGLATAGMLIGVAVFVAPTIVTQILIGGGAVATAIAMPFWQDTTLQLIVRLFMGVCLVIAGAVAVVALGRGGLPKNAGAPPDPAALKKKIGGFLPAEWAVYLGTAVSVAIFAFVVQRHTVATWVLNVTGVVFLIYIVREMVKLGKVQRERLQVVLLLFLFNMLFWAFFEQAGTSLNNWTDRNLDRVTEDRVVAAEEVGTSIEFRVPVATTDPELSKLPILTQEQLGHENGDPTMKDTIVNTIRADEKARGKLKPEEIDALAAGVRKYSVLTMTGLSALRGAAAKEGAADDVKRIRWKVIQENVGMGVGSSEIPASEFQAANPIYILLFGLVFSALWTFLASRKLDPSTPVKFALGILQLGLGFGVFWLGARSADARGMSGIIYLLAGWLLLTTGELCLSPVGLSMITRLSPKHLVSTVMGGWFLATAFSNLLAALIATFTAVGHGDEGVQVIPPPKETVSLYGDVLGLLALVAIGAAVVCFILAPFLSKWMHSDVSEEEEERETAAKAAA